MPINWGLNLNPDVSQCLRCGCKGYHAYDIGRTCYGGSGYSYFGVLVICNFCNFEHIVHSLSRKSIVNILNKASSIGAGHDTVRAVLS